MFLDRRWKEMSDGPSVDSVKVAARLFASIPPPCEMRIMGPDGKVFQSAMAEPGRRIRWIWPEKDGGKKCICGEVLPSGYNTFCPACCALPRDRHGIPMRRK
jgi:hypothetical protein